MSAHKFSQIPKAEIQRSSFDRSHGVKTTIDGGYLYPVFIDEALPGDTFNLKMHAIARLATPIFPIMDNIYLDTFFFSVPNRLIWDNWQKFNGEQNDPNDSTDYTLPTLSGVIAAGSLGDYFGLPTGYDTTGKHISSLPYRAYNLVWKEWFRDENLQTSPAIFNGDVSDTVAAYPLQRRGKRHDYFSSSLPWPQKGQAVDIPLGGSAPVIPTSAGHPAFITSVGASMGSIGQFGTGSAASFEDDTATSIAYWGSQTGLQADLSSATAATINSLRQAFQVQKILERDARGGTRYTEIIKAHFGVTSPDARLQRPEYLGGYSQPVNISTIHQTQSSEAATTPLGQVSAIGTAVLGGRDNSFTHSFTEHCTVIGLIAVRAELTYQQQINRMWSRRTRFDFYWPALAHIGEQAVLSKEIFADGTAGDDTVWGYQERYAEYRFKPSYVTGKFRSNDAQSLDSWHLALDYAARPVLNATFIQDQPPLDRVVAVPSEPKFLLDAWFDFKCARPMPMYGVPGLIDHF